MTQPSNVQPGFTKAELHELYTLGTKLCMAWNKFDCVYRCKPQSYYDDILTNHNGLEKVYLKDGSGHQRNNINGTLKGLFFSVRSLGHNRVPDSSPFGNTMLKLPPRQLLDPTVVNLYFCDFYCHNLNAWKPDATHYATVVFCHKGSESDRFCQEKLIPLPSDNPFLRIKEVDGEYTFESNGIFAVCVEIFYTEDIQIDQSKFKKLNVSPLTSSTPGGIPNNPNCKKCNLKQWLKKRGPANESAIENGSKLKSFRRS